MYHVYCTMACMYLVSSVPCIVCTLYHVYHGLSVPWAQPPSVSCISHSHSGHHQSAHTVLYHIHSTLLLQSISFTINHSTQYMNRHNTFAETVERAGHYDQYLVLCVGELLHVLLQGHYMNWYKSHIPFVWKIIQLVLNNPVSKPWHECKVCLNHYQLTALCVPLSESPSSDLRNEDADCKPPINAPLLLNIACYASTCSNN